MDSLCKTFDVPGKISEYTLEYNNIKILDDEPLFNKLFSYAVQDSRCLYQALFKAQQIYHREYNVDITSIVSTANLSFKIFRSKYMDNNVKIPILTRYEDSFIRKSYFGGSTDIYKEYGRNLHYYDVNSLYPHVMSYDMPYEVKGYVNPYQVNRDLNSFFGFAEVEVYCPQNIKHPMWPWPYPIFIKARLYTCMVTSLEHISQLNYKLLKI